MTIPHDHEMEQTSATATESAPEGAADAANTADGRSSRRRFFALGTSAVAALATSRVVAAQPPRTGGSRGLPLPPASAGAIEAAQQWKDPLLRLVRRITMGMSPEEVALARQRGFTGYLEYQLNASAIDDSALEAMIAQRLPMTQMNGTTLRTQDSNEVMMQLSDAAWYRALFARAQLRERMVEFWTDHFSIDFEVANVTWRKVLDDRDVIRRHAMGNVRDMVIASAHSSAMLNYLNQDSSRTPTPNQNYAREIMELHTLGVDGGYTQTDVAELSRILTGWSSNGTDGAFLWRRTYHDRNAKTFLGRTFPAMPTTATDVAMKAEGDQAIEMLLDHPATGRYIGYKMARWLLAHEPSPAVVDAVAAAYTSSRGDIKTMIRAILTSKNLLAAPAKYKRPFHLAVSAMRSLGARAETVLNVRQARTQSDPLGMPLYRWDQPDGYPDQIGWWSGLVLSRWSYVEYISSTRTTATNYRFDAMPFRTPDTPEGVVAQINTRIYAGEMPTRLRSSLLSYLRGGTYSDARVRETISLALSAHEFQWY